MTMMKNEHATQSMHQAATAQEITNDDASAFVAIRASH